MPGESEAAEWSLLPSMTVRGVYNDNLLLTSLPHDVTYGAWVSPAVEFAGKTERLGVRSRVAADFVRYYGGEERRFTNLFFPLAVRYQREQDVLEFTGGLTRDNTLMSELLSTGLVLQFTQRNQWAANPSWTRSLTEQLSLQVSSQVYDTTYENGLRLGLVNYQLFGGSVGLLYQATEQDQIQLSGSYTDFHTTNAPLPVRAGLPGATLGLTHAFTEGLTGTISGGPRVITATSQSPGGRLKSRDTVWLFNGNLINKFERATVQVSATRDVVPTGFGLLIQTERVAASVSHEAGETVTASFEASGYRVSGVATGASGGAFSEQRLLYLSPKISWKFLEWWRAELSYTYQRREGESAQSFASSNAAMFAVTYFPPKSARSE